MNTKFALLSAVAAISVSTMVALPAAAQDYERGTYFSFAAGANFPGSSSVLYHNTPTGTFTNAKTTFDTGYILSGAVGYRWSNIVRTEAEFNYRRAKVDDIAGAPAPGSQRVMGLMGNVLFDIGEWGGIRPYVGGGAGVGWNKWSGVQGGASATFPAGTANFNDRDMAFQWQGIAGVSKAITRSTEGFVEYRYIGLEQNKFTGTPVGAAASRHDDRSHNVLAGVRINF